MQGRETLVSIDRAHALFGYEPEHHISDPMDYRSGARQPFPWRPVGGQTACLP
jgi:hypothetical protein